MVDKDCDKNIVYVSNSDLLVDLARREFVATDVNWISGAPAATNLRVKLRHGPRMLNCTLKVSQDESSATSSATSGTTNNYDVLLEAADSGLANGQFAVFYDENTCLGAGMIRLLPHR